MASKKKKAANRKLPTARTAATTATPAASTLVGLGATVTESMPTAGAGGEADAVAQKLREVGPGHDVAAPDLHALRKRAGLEIGDVDRFARFEPGARPRLPRTGPFCFERLAS